MVEEDIRAMIGVGGYEEDRKVGMGFEKIGFEALQVATFPGSILVNGQCVVELSSSVCSWRTLSSESPRQYQINLLST